MGDKPEEKDQANISCQLIFFAAAAAKTGGLDLCYYVSRSGSGLPGRMVGEIFQAINNADVSSGVVNLYAITTAPADNMLTTVNVSVATGYRYYRYLSPNGSYGDIAEIAFFG